MENQENHDPQTVPKPPLATGKRVLVLAFLAAGLWVFYVLRVTLPRNTDWLLGGGSIVAVVGGLILLVRAVQKRRFGKYLLAGGLLLTATAAFWVSYFYYATREYRDGDTYNASANRDAKNAYVSAQAYFADHPEKTADLNAIDSYDSMRSKSVILTVENGTRSGLSIISRHKQGTKIYHVDHGGNIKCYALME